MRKLLKTLARWRREAYFAVTNDAETELVFCVGNREVAERELLGGAR